MNILITCDRLDTLGGLEEHVTDKVCFLLNKGHRVHLDCNAISEHYMKKIEHENLSVSSPWSDNWNDVLIDIKGFIPDIIHAHPFSAVSRGWIVQQELFDNKIPLIITIHGEYQWNVQSEINKYVHKYILVNNKIKGYENKCNTVVIPNGIDIKRFYNRNFVTLDYDTKDIVVATRLQDNKEIPVFKFLSACRYLKHKVNVHIVGDGRYLDEVKEKIRVMSLSPDRIKFNVMGAVSNIEVYYNFANLVLGCDRVALEALCCMTHVFYMGQGHFKNLISDNNFNDFLFTNKGICDYSHVELAEKIDNILDNELYSFNMQELSSKIRDEYSIDSQMKKILNIYEELVKGR